MQKAKGSKHRTSTPTKLFSAAYCFLPSAFCFSEFILVVIIVQVFILNDIQLDGIEADDLECDATLVAIHCLAFVHIDINMNVGIAFWACSGRHCPTSSECSIICAA